jgi:hypothetical protein
MKWEPRKPARLDDHTKSTLGTSVPSVDSLREREFVPAEARSRERAVLMEIRETHGRAANVCPECGSADWHHVDGCMVCFSCGYSPCGVH